MKLLILFIALSYVHSSPIVQPTVTSDKTPVAPTPVEHIQPPTVVENVPQPLTTSTNDDKKLTRVVRDNKVEYVYLDPNGRVINKHGLKSENSDSRIVHVLDHENFKISQKDKEAEAKRQLEAKSDDKSSSDALHYASGVKVRSDGRRLSNGQISSPAVASYSAPVDSSLLSSLYLPQLSSSYPLTYPSLLQSVYSPYNYLLSSGLYPVDLMSSYNNPLLSSQSISPLLTRSSANLASMPEELDTRRNVARYYGLDLISSLLGNSLNSNRLYSPIGNLFNRGISSMFSSAYQTPYINPFFSYLNNLIPQQTPNYNYLSSRIGGLNGLGGYDSYGLSGLGSGLSGLAYDPIIGIGSGLNGLSELNGLNNFALPRYSSMLTPGYIPPYGSSLINSINPLYNQIGYFGQLGSQLGLIPPYSLIPPYIGSQFGSNLNPGSNLGQSLLPQDALNIRRATPTVSTSSDLTSNALPFTDSVNNQPATTSPAASSTVLIPGLTETAANVANDLVFDKPLLYAAQNAALRTFHHNPLITNSGYYSSRLIDPITGYPMYGGYPSSYYGRYPLSLGSQYYRPISYINSPYTGAYGPYNGVGYITPFNGMHYSADPNVGKKIETVHPDSKPVVAKEEMKDTLSHVNHNTPNK